MISRNRVVKVLTFEASDSRTSRSRTRWALGCQSFGIEQLLIIRNFPREKIVDIQGINWGSLGRSRAAYRALRHSEYTNFRSLPDVEIPLPSGLKRLKTIQDLNQSTAYYSFLFTCSSTRTSIGHFQLRNLVWATSKHDVFYTGKYFFICDIQDILSLILKRINKGSHEVKHWNPITNTNRVVFDAEVLGIPKLSTMTASPLGHLLGGGYFGEYVYCSLSSPIKSPVKLGSFTTDPNGITNQMKVESLRSGSVGVVVSSNDMRCRIVELEKWTTLRTILTPWAINVILYLLF